MLKRLSRMRRTQSAIIILFAILLGVSLIFFYAPRGNEASAAAPRDTEAIAEVGRNAITVGELNQATQSLQERFGGQISVAQFGGPRRLLDGLIDQKVAAQQAQERGLWVSDKEVSDEVHRQFSNNGRFVGIERYREYVTSQFGDVGRFEERIRQDLAAAKLRAFITAGVRVSDEEVQENFKRENTKFNLVYVPLTVEKIAARLQPSDADLQNYYDRNKESFRLNVPQKKITYLFIDQAKAGSRLDIPEADLRAAYDRLPEDKRIAGVRVQQIVLRVARPDLNQSVQQQAAQIASDLRAKAGENNVISPEAFAEVARGRSEDPATAKEGGLLPNPVRQDANKPKDSMQRVFELEAGQITEPTKIGNAYYIFRRGEGVPQSFEQKKQELLVSERNRRAYAAAQQLAARGVEGLRAGANIQQVAQELAAPANMTPAEMVRETGYIKPGDDVANIGVNQQFEEVIAPLDQPGKTGERVGIKGGIAVPQLSDVRPPRIPELAEVHDQVAARVREEAARGKLEQVARDLAANSNNPAELRQRAAAIGLEVQTADDYKLGSPLGAAGTSPAADAAIYALAENSVTRTPVKTGDNYVVIAAAKRTEADLTEFAKQRDTLAEQALTERQTQVYQDFISAARRRMEQNGDVKINNDLLARVVEQAEDAAPPLMAPPGAGGGGGLPFPPNG